MNENEFLSQSDINGLWKASYSKDVNGAEPAADSEKQASIMFDGGLLSGDDPFGGKYSGIYTVKEGTFSARVEATSSDPEAESVLGVAFPFTLDLFGNYTSPDYFSVVGKVVDSDKQIVVNCRRAK